MDLHPGDGPLVDAFFRSLEWYRVKQLELFKRKRGLQDGLRVYLRMEFRIPSETPTPLELELMVGRIGKYIRSNWAKKAARTRKKRAQLRRRMRLKRLLKKIEWAEHKRRGRKRAERRPMLFSDLPIQRKPQGKVA
ncbi:hypothetical protein HY970_04010 [Candidatus Kaiserbacteria bacterium]|nr:hypothetical protein [Candidatus Kaiserbacteria bacterium]